MSKKKKSAKAAPTEQSNTTQESSNQNKKSRKLTGKDLILTFFLFFIVFGFVGYFRGRSVRNKPERLRWDVMSRLALGASGSQRVLAYRCNGNNEVVWRVDRNDYLELRTADRPPEEFSYSPAILNDENLIPVFLTGGGVASIFTAKEILGFVASSRASSKIEKAPHIRLIVMAALAIVSGYEIGYRIALSSNYNCGDSRFTHILNDEENWKGDDKGWSGFEKIYWNYLLEKVEQRAPKGFCRLDDIKKQEFENNKFNIAKAHFILFRDGGVTSLDHDITSADFEALRIYEQAIDEFNRNCRTQSN